MYFFKCSVIIILPKYFLQLSVLDEPDSHICKYTTTDATALAHRHTSSWSNFCIYVYMIRFIRFVQRHTICLSVGVCLCVCVWNAGCTLPLANKGPPYPSNSVNPSDPWIPLAVGKFNYLPLISSFVFCSPLLHSYLLYSILNCYIYIANLHTRVHRQCNCTHRI